jgi:hypothetical protein
VVVRALEAMNYTFPSTESNKKVRKQKAGLRFPGRFMLTPIVQPTRQAAVQQYIFFVLLRHSWAENMHLSVLNAI